MNETLSYIEWQSGGHTLRGSAHVPKAGNGIWVIFSHGFTSHRIGPDYLYVTLSRRLSREGIGSVRFDYAGSGESDGQYSEMTMDSMRENLISAVQNVKDRYNPRTILILGHSLGGLVALTTSSLRAVDGLILLAPLSRPQNHIPLYEHVIAGGMNQRGLYEMGPYQLDIAFLHSIQIVGSPDELLDAFRGKMQILHGDNDETVALEESESLVKVAREKNIQTAFDVIKGADHRFSSVAARDTLQQMILSWLKEQYL